MDKDTEAFLYDQLNNSLQAEVSKLEYMIDITGLVRPVILEWFKLQRTTPRKSSIVTNLETLKYF